MRRRLTIDLILIVLIPVIVVRDVAVEFVVSLIDAMRWGYDTWRYRHEIPIKASPAPRVAHRREEGS
jgi:hypothetical protein